MPWAGKRDDLNPLRVGPVPEGRDTVRRILLWRLVGKQQLHDHAARLHRAVGRGLHRHIGRWFADAGRRQNALAFDLDHAGAAIAVGAVARLGEPAQVGNVDAFAPCHLPDGFAGTCRNDFSVDREEQLVSHDLVFPAAVALILNLVTIRLSGHFGSAPACP